MAVFRDSCLSSNSHGTGSGLQFRVYCLQTRFFSVNALKHCTYTPCPKQPPETPPINPNLNPKP